MTTTDTPQRQRSVTGVVLAGGDSTRFDGGHKAVAELDGRPLIGRVLDAVESATGPRPVVAVRTASQRALLRDAIVDHDPRFGFDDRSFAGPLGGLYGALDAVESPWVFVCGCDMPALSTTALADLFGRIDHGVDAVVPANESGVLEPLHACYRRSALQSVREEVPETGGPRVLVDRLPEVAVVRPDDSSDPAAFEASLTNVNTREALRGCTETILASSGVGKP